MPRTGRDPLEDSIQAQFWFTALRRSNDLFEHFCKVAGDLAGFAAIGFYYWRMSQAGPRSRCEVVRQYLLLCADHDRQPDLIAHVQQWSDDDIIEVCDVLGIPI